MNTDCKQCDESLKLTGDRCPKHLLEYKKWVAETAQESYMEELRNQSRKGKKDE